jgi:hypothetical protein
MFAALISYIIKFLKKTVSRDGRGGRTEGEMVGNGDEEFPKEMCRKCFFGAKFGEIST